MDLTIYNLPTTTEYQTNKTFINEDGLYIDLQGDAFRSRISSLDSNICCYHNLVLHQALVEYLNSVPDRYGLCGLEELMQETTLIRLNAAGGYVSFPLNKPTEDAIATLDDWFHTTFSSRTRPISIMMERTRGDMYKIEAEEY